MKNDKNHKKVQKLAGIDIELVKNIIYYYIYTVRFIFNKVAFQGGDIVSIDVIKSIKEAEEKAEQLIRQSLADARQIISEAENQSVKIQEKAIEEAEKRANEIIEQQEKAAEAEILQMKKSIDQECSKIKEQAEKHFDKAVDMILGRIVKIHGNS